MTLLEAMSLGKPCVVTNAGGNPEIIQNGVNGIVSENKNVNEFSLAIEVLIRNKEKRALMATESLKRYEQLFSSVKMNSEYSRIYQE
jgi:glycosyltransferase involved in cell wall biosynthesis